MSLNSIKDLKVTSIGTKTMTNDERPLLHNGNVNWTAFDKMRKNYPICFDHSVDMVSFKVMTSPASEGGNGAQWTDMVEVGLHMLKYFNDKFPCEENKHTIHHLEAALNWQVLRAQSRVARNVEGKDEK